MRAVISLPRIVFIVIYSFGSTVFISRSLTFDDEQLAALSDEVFFSLLYVVILFFGRDPISSTDSPLLFEGNVFFVYRISLWGNSFFYIQICIDSFV